MVWALARANDGRSALLLHVVYLKIVLFKDFTPFEIITTP